MAEHSTERAPVRSPVHLRSVDTRMAYAGAPSAEEQVAVAPQIPDHTPTAPGVAEAALQSIVQRVQRVVAAPSAPPIRATVGVAGVVQRVNGPTAPPKRLAERETITKAIKDSYGIDLDNAAGERETRALYKMFLPPGKRTEANVPRMHGISWTVSEMRMLKTVLDRYGPILSASKNDPNRRIKTLSRLSQGLDVDTSGSEPTVKLDSSTGAETFTQNVGSQLSNISMYDTAYKGTDFGGTDKNKEWRGTLTHEFSHGLVETTPAPTGAGNDSKGKPITTMLGYWVKKTDYWLGVTAKRTTTTEDPITAYGKKNAREDMAEAIMFFFESPAKLKADCPVRFKFIVDYLSPHLGPASLMQVDIDLGGSKANPKVQWPTSVTIPWP